MISVFFNCSSPYVGYSLRKADYLQKRMALCPREEMTRTGYAAFTSSGSYALLGQFDGKTYFHSRESKSKKYDEQGRRIYTNIAFVGQNSADTIAIRRIAAYAFFNEEAFYEEITKMITLLDDGFTVNFEALALFLQRFAEGTPILRQGNPEASQLLRYLDKPTFENTVDLIVLESTWNYFVKQVKDDFHKSVGRQFSLEQARAISNGVVFALECSEQDTLQSPNVPLSEIEIAADHSAVEPQVVILPPQMAEETPEAEGVETAPEAEKAEEPEKFQPIQTQETPEPRYSEIIPDPDDAGDDDQSKTFGSNVIRYAIGALLAICAIGIVFAAKRIM